MKQTQTACRFVAMAALAMLIAGCAGDHLEEQKRLAYSAGFKVINPVKPDQVALLPTLPKDKVTPIHYKGNTYYILPDAKNNQAFVGGQIEFRHYQKLCMNEKVNAEVEASEQMSHAGWVNANWGAWGGWGGVGSYGRAVRYGLR
jgi:hypothetical protein